MLTATLPKPQATDVPLYRNAIEPLVIKEVERQLPTLPQKLLDYVSEEKITAQVIAYALNRLPACYATSKRGWELQLEAASTIYKDDIVAAVTMGLAAIQRDPLKRIWDKA